jgi:hypothetical protein
LAKFGWQFSDIMDVRARRRTGYRDRARARSFAGDDFIAAILIAFRSRLANAPDYVF